MVSNFRNSPTKLLFGLCMPAADGVFKHSKGAKTEPMSWLWMTTPVAVVIGLLTRLRLLTITIRSKGNTINKKHSERSISTLPKSVDSECLVHALIYQEWAPHRNLWFCKKSQVEAASSAEASTSILMSLCCSVALAGLCLLFSCKLLLLSSVFGRSCLLVLPFCSSWWCYSWLFRSFCFSSCLSGSLSCDLLSNLVEYPIARYPENLNKCDSPSLAEPLCCDRTFLARQKGYSSDSLRNPEKQNATGVLLHLSCDRGSKLAGPLSMLLLVFVDVVVVHIVVVAASCMSSFLFVSGLLSLLLSLTLVIVGVVYSIGALIRHAMLLRIMLLFPSLVSVVVFGSTCLRISVQQHFLCVRPSGNAEKEDVHTPPPPQFSEPWAGEFTKPLLWLWCVRVCVCLVCGMCIWSVVCVCVCLCICGEAVALLWRFFVVVACQALREPEKLAATTFAHSTWASCPNLSQLANC